MGGASDAARRRGDAVLRPQPRPAGGVWRTVCVMTLLLQLSIGQGKTLRQLADLMMQHEGESSPGLIERLRGDLREAGAAAKAVEGEEWPWSSADAAQSTWAEHCRHAVAAAQA